MKNLFIIFSIFMFGCLISCGDYLSIDKYVNDMLNLDSVFTRRRYTDDWLNNVYSTMYGKNMEIANKRNCAFNYASDDLIYGDDLLPGHTYCREYQNCEYSPDYQLSEDRWGVLYEGIRKASIFIYNVDKCSEMTMAEKEDARGQARFLRAYFYWLLMKQYGPICIMPEEGMDLSLSYDELSIARSSYDDCVNYLDNELLIAARVLPQTRTASWFGKPTTGAALALRAKILLYAASPLFNGNEEMFELKNKDNTPLINPDYDVKKWARAAAAAKEVINLGNYELLTIAADSTTVIPPDNVPSEPYPNGAGGIDHYKSYASLFNGEIYASTIPEIIWGYYNDEIKDIMRHTHPLSLQGWNTIAVTQKQVDAYYMNDGRTINEATDVYNPKTFTLRPPYPPFLSINVSMMYAYREPRFYASIAYSGSIWECLSSVSTGYKNAKIYYYKGEANGKTLSDTRLFLRTGTAMRKYYHPDDTWDPQNTSLKPKISPLLRYADVLLWYAEALNELPDGQTYEFDTYNSRKVSVSRDVNEMRSAFSRIRFRAGLPDASQSVYNDRDQFRTVLKRERQIEFFAEAIRYFDLRRWKDAEIEEAIPISGLNVDMEASKRANFMEIVPSDMPKVFLKPKMYLWPISTTEMKRNAKLVQNPGWR
ncbi:MAG: RagB/SusD family nutrient uptake outer membrane protein [Dysgonamonadaceae bacterium]|jgi:hypothetical protein|nr:RagB/SusD family nutrient uptake outer membrane protein [Dysgonamonadaceae bacterium]